MSKQLDKPTRKFYGTLFNKNTALGKLNRTLDPAGKKVADDAIEKTTPITEDDVQIAKPLPMPDADSEAVGRARRRRIAQQRSQSGRESTFLSNSGEAKLGG
jgi:hypothetical protein